MSIRLLPLNSLMQFRNSDGVSFEIPTEWLESAGMSTFVPNMNAYTFSQNEPTIVVSLANVAPCRRIPGIAGFSKDGFNEERTISILRAFCSDTPLPPVEANELSSGPYRYKLQNGMHRYYASVAAGFSHLPVVVREDVQAFFDDEAAAGAARQLVKKPYEVGLLSIARSSAGANES